MYRRGHEAAGLLRRADDPHGPQLARLGAGLLAGQRAPIFNSILSIASATFIAWFTFGFAAVLWFNMF